MRIFESMTLDFCSTQRTKQIQEVFLFCFKDINVVEKRSEKHLETLK